MIETYFTSDHHFGHKKILEYEKESRPFDTVEEMNEQLIANWNETVNPKDIVFHLGDFAFGRINISIANRLNGKKYLIMGNHDSYGIDLYVSNFQKIFGAHVYKKCILTHIPVHPEHLGQRFRLNVHGHLHSKNVLKPMNPKHVLVSHEGVWRNPEACEGIVYIKDPRYFNVSCEQNNLKPVHSSVIMERLKEIFE